MKINTSLVKIFKNGQLVSFQCGDKWLLGRIAGHTTNTFLAPGAITEYKIEETHTKRLYLRMVANVAADHLDSKVDEMVSMQ